MKQQWVRLGPGHTLPEFELTAHLKPYDQGTAQARGMLGANAGGTVWRGYVYTDTKQSEHPYNYEHADFATEAEARAWVETTARLEFT